ncbi:MAG: helix-turn-helix transcriptional regulator [Novosphingobium sp.]
MSYLPPASVALSRLNAKEREVLRLLTAGHTVKSIAAQLGRSEASINERLREARRKTGIGSSRELARLLDAQINRDRKIDLAASISTADGPVQPRAVGRQTPKGPILMLIALTLAASTMALTRGDAGPAAVPHAAAAAAVRQSPLAGRWALDTSKIPAEERPRAVTITFTAAPGDQWYTKVEIVAPDGSVRTAESTAMPGGAAVPITGTMDFIDTVKLRQPEPGTIVMTLGKNGKPVSTRVYTVSNDRKSMTETIIWAADALPGLETTYFNRVG